MMTMSQRKAKQRRYFAKYYRDNAEKRREYQRQYYWNVVKTSEEATQRNRAKALRYYWKRKLEGA